MNRQQILHRVAAIGSEVVHRPEWLAMLLEHGQRHPLEGYADPIPAIRQRAALLAKVYSEFQYHSPAWFGLGCDRIEMLWDWWLPLGQWIAQQRQASQRLIVLGLLGGQGTGKTTLCRGLVQILRVLGYRAISLSLDDLYKTYAERQQLQQQDPRLVWRGPPGTHDVDLGVKVLDWLRFPKPGQTIAIPRFDKSAYNGAGDRTTPELVRAIDLVLFEGWFVGLRPIDPQVFDQAPAPIVTAADRTFARDMNQQLQDYLPLWQQLDYLLVLKLRDYRWSKAWRQQAEQQMIASGKPGMTAAEVDAFVDYFWKALHPQLYLPPLLQPPSPVDWVIEIEADRSPSRISQPT